MPTPRLLPIALAVALTVPVVRPAAQSTIAARLVGHWRLVSVDTHLEGAAPTAALGASPVGTILYTADGRMQAHLTLAARPKARPADAPADVLRELLRYTAYFGTYTVDERAGTVTHRRDGTLAPGERDFVRTVSLDGSRLVLTTPVTVADGRKRFTAITWERLPAAAPAPGYTAAARAAVAGTWELVDHRTLLADGTVRRAFGTAPLGHFVFHADGHTAVQIVNPERPSTPVGQADEATLRTLARTYLAYFGTYDVDQATRKIVVHTTADLNPMNTGADQIRFYTVDADTLVLQPPPSAVPGGQQVSRITWRRVR
ncbi:MAG: lipocalin-like domain-containing protein [Vicinamibacterales bacterium]